MFDCYTFSFAFRPTFCLLCDFYKTGINLRIKDFLKSVYNYTDCKVLIIKQHLVYKACQTLFKEIFLIDFRHKSAFS